MQSMHTREVLVQNLRLVMELVKYGMSLERAVSNVARAYCLSMTQMEALFDSAVERIK